MRLIRAHVEAADAEFVELASAVDRLDKAPSHRHIPTARVPLELCSGLIAEWGVTPKTDGWHGVLDGSLAGFEQRRTAP